MLDGIIAALTISSVLTAYNFYRMEYVRFFNYTLTISLTILFSIVYFFTFDTYFVHSSAIKDIKNATSSTIDNIKEMTSVKSDKNIDKEKYEEDKTSRSKNKNIFTYSFSITILVCVISLFFLRVFTKNFYKDIKNVIFNVALVKVIQLYFIFTFKNNYKNQSLEVIRKIIIDRFKEI